MESTHCELDYLHVGAGEHGHVPQHFRGDGVPEANHGKGLNPTACPLTARARSQVDTDMCRSIRAAMGVPEANRGKNLLQADDSARRVVGMIERLDADTSGTFWAADTGEVLSW